MRLRRLPRAIRDVDAIWDWVARDNEDAASRLLQRIVEATDRLTDFPESGTPRPELGRGVRSVVVGNYVVLYRVAPDAIEIVRVVHGARDLGNLS